MVSDSALLRTLTLALVAVALSPAVARAATFEVNTTDDVFGTQGCSAVVCTLRSALGVATSNGSLEDDTIILKAGTYTLGTQDGSLQVPVGQTRIFIRGAGANSTVIQPQTKSAFRVFTVAGGVELSDLTLRDGGVASGEGGNLWVQGGANVTLTRTRITGGSAPAGGGIAAQASNATTLNISQSLIDGNTATGTAVSAAGGGLYIDGQTFSAAVTIQDSTISGNDARNGGGIAVNFNAGSPPVLNGVTLARNTARAGSPTGVGGIYSNGATARFQGSIVAGNTTNCGLGTAATDLGGNVETKTDCGFTASGHQNTDPQLASALDSSQPPVLAIGANSPAVDVAACGTRTVDQRGVARPQLQTCDAGAYEYQPPPTEPPPTPTATPAPVPTATPIPTATPVAGKSVGAAPVSGKVLVKLPKAKRFVPLDPSVIANGAEVDTRKGVVEITRSDGGAAKFYDGIFKVSQAGGITTLALSEKLTGCPKAKPSTARAAAAKPKTRKLWGDGKGKFRTKGTYSAATVRGTKWLVQDGCRFTKTTVALGTVSVRDEVKKTTITLRKGKSYTARPRR